MMHKTAADIMIPVAEYPHVLDTMTLIQAMTVIKMKLWETKTADGRRMIPRAILVFNDKQEFVGLVRRRDIMRGLVPGFRARRQPKHREAFIDVKVDSAVAELAYDRATEGMRERCKRRIRDIMVPLTPINHDDHLMKAIHMMVEFDASQLPVIKEGTVVGVLRSVDLLHEIEMFLGIEQDDDGG